MARFESLTRQLLSVTRERLRVKQDHYEKGKSPSDSRRSDFLSGVRGKNSEHPAYPRAHNFGCIVAICCFVSVNARQLEEH
jgi:hypothetical protein